MKRFSLLPMLAAWVALGGGCLSLADVALVCASDADCPSDYACTAEVCVLRGGAPPLCGDGAVAGGGSVRRRQPCRR